MIRGAGTRLLLGAALATGAAGCHYFGQGASVTRVADGVPYEGRFISPDGYAAYARGAALEARGELDEALELYHEALRLDLDSAELWARIGAVRCRFSERSARWVGAAEEAFRKALRRDAHAAVAWAEVARCAARTAQKDRALEAALTAARLDPDSVELQLLVVERAEAVGERELAAAWLDALVTRSPESRSAWRALSAFAARHSDAGRRFRAERELAPGSADDRAAALDRALRAGDLAAARALAIALRQSAADLAIRAVELGALELAEAQAELVLGADPEDPNAWVAALAAADLARDEPRFEARLRAAPDEPAAPLSAAARRLLDQLLARRAGE